MLTLKGILLLLLKYMVLRRRDPTFLHVPFPVLTTPWTRLLHQIYYTQAMSFIRDIFHCEHQFSYELWLLMTPIVLFFPVCMCRYMYLMPAVVHYLVDDVWNQLQSVKSVSLRNFLNHLHVIIKLVGLLSQSEHFPH